MKQALLFDLDETLVVEEPAAVRAFLATAEYAARRCDLDAEQLARAARTRARELWYAASTHEYCMRVGISSWEGLWCRFEGDGGETQLLREWSPTYRRESWRLALVDQGVDDPGFGEELGERFGSERRARHEVFGDVVEVLDELSQSHAMALVTNGAACLQREKLAASGLGELFETVVVSADIGIAKPEVGVFERAVAQLGVEPGDAVMVGDSLAKDVDGAIAAGLGAVWVNRGGSPVPPHCPNPVEISTLRDLPSALGEFLTASRSQ